MFTFGLVLGVAAGGALIWFAKDKVTLWYKSSEDVIGELNDRIRKLKGE
jgi:hypothetical protein